MLSWLFWFGLCVVGGYVYRYCEAKEAEAIETDT